MEKTTTGALVVLAACSLLQTAHDLKSWWPIAGVAAVFAVGLAVGRLVARRERG